LDVLGKVVRRSALDEPRELLAVERIPARPGEELGLRLRRQHGALEQCMYELGRLVIREGRKRQRRRVRLAAAPARSPLEQLWARGGEDEQRDAAGAVDEVVDEVE
jgi:hypothetical protein